MFGRKRIKELEAEIKELEKDCSDKTKTIISLRQNVWYLEDHVRKINNMTNFICAEYNISAERFGELKREFDIV